VGPGSSRLFVALWPSPETREACASQRDAWTWTASARPTADADLHVTLRFIGSVPSSRIDALAAALAIAAEPFVLRFDRVAVWRNGVAAFEPSATPAALTRLHEAIADRLAEIGFPGEDRRFRPHVTLARDARGSVAPSEVAPTEWPVERFVLVESRGGRYRPLRDYALGAIAS